MKHILVSVTYLGVLHWRLIAARPVGKYWEISMPAYNQFLKDIKYISSGCRCGRCGSSRIHVG